MSLPDIEKDQSSLEDSQNLQFNHGQDLSVDEKAAGEAPSAVQAPNSDFPEGGLRGWSVVFGTASLLFCTFGYANAFG